MARPKEDQIETTKRLMGALGRMKPKQHKEMKIGKKSEKTKKTTARKANRRLPVSRKGT